MLDRSLYSFAVRRWLRFSYCFLCAALAAFHSVLSVLQSWSGGAVGVVGADRGLARSSCTRRPGLRRMEAKRETQRARSWLMR